MKRITVFSGHYGSGKTNVAISVALDAAKAGKSMTVADLDIVNPYFRTKDSAKELEAAGIELICSDYANTNVDIPALPQSMYAITDDRSRSVIVDLGGHKRDRNGFGASIHGHCQQLEPRRGDNGANRAFISSLCGRNIPCFGAADCDDDGKKRTVSRAARKNQKS